MSLLHSGAARATSKVQPETRSGWRATVLGFVAAMTLLFATPIHAQSVIYSPGAVDLGTIGVGAPASSAQLDFTISGSDAINVASVTATSNGSTGEDFKVASQNCVGTLLPPANCSVTVAFAPVSSGMRRGAVTLLDSASHPLVNVVIHGIGTGPELVFAPATATTLASVAPLSPATYEPSAVMYDGSGNLFFNDILNNRILEMAAGGALSVVASPVPGSTPASIALSAGGVIYVSSPSNSMVYTIAGGTPTALTISGATLKQPTGLAFDANGFLYIADATSNDIVRCNADGSSAAVLPITGLAKPLSGPIGLTIGIDGALYVVDSNNARIVRIDLTTYAATVLATTGSTLNQPYGITVDPSGTFYVADTGNKRIVTITASGVAAPLFISSEPFLIPTGIAISSVGDLVVADDAMGLVTISRSTTTITFPTPTPVNMPDTVDGDEVLVVQNIGNATAQFTIPAGTATNPAFDTPDFTLSGSGSCPQVTSATLPATAQLAVAASCLYGIDFTPSVIGTDTGHLLLTSGPVGSATTVTQSVTLIGTGSAAGLTLSIVASPSTVPLGTPVGGTVTVSGPNAASYRGTIHFSSTDPNAIFLFGNTYTFTAADAGTHVFPASHGILFSAPGIYTVSITDGTNSATSNPVTVTGAAQATTTTLTAAPNPALINQTVILTATVAPTAGSGVPTGTVTFFNGTGPIGTAPLVNGTATLSTSFITTGSFNLTAVYSSDPNFSASTSAIVVEVVNLQATATTLTAAPNPALINQTVILTATVAPTAGSGVPTGTVTFFNGTGPIGTAPLVNGTATLSTSFITTGSFNLTAVYSSDPNFSASTSAIVVEVVNLQATATTLTAAPNPALINQTVILTATVAPTAGSGVPTGTVTFFNGTGPIGTAPLVNGTATLSTSFITTGSFNLTAVYSSDPNFSASTSAIVVEVVNLQATATTLTAAPNPALINQTVILTATVAPTAGSGVPTGTVTFFNGTGPIGTAPLVNGTATLSTSFITTGSFNLTAVYSSDPNFSRSTSPIYVEVVNPGQQSTTTTLTAAPNPAFIGMTVTLTSTVVPATSGTPTGTIMFADGGTPLATVALVNGAASFATTFATAGPHNLTATYSGDANDTASTSAVFVETILAPLPTATTLMVTPNPVLLDAPITLTAMTTAAAGTPSGMITFLDGGAPIGSAPLVNGVATLVTAFTVSGAQNLTAMYTGTLAFATSTSPVFVETVEDISFTLAQTGTSLSVFPGQTATFQFNVAPVGGTMFLAPITFSVAGLPPGATAVFTPDTVNTGDAATNVSLAITSPLMGSLRHEAFPWQRATPVVFAFALLPFALRKRRRFASLLLLFVLTASTLGLTGCLTDQASGYFGSVPKKYNLTVTATSGVIVRSVYVTLTVE